MRNIKKIETVKFNCNLSELTNNADKGKDYRVDFHKLPKSVMKQIRDANLDSNSFYALR